MLIEEHGHMKAERHREKLCGGKGGVPSSVKDCQQPPESGKRQAGFPSRLPRVDVLADTLIEDLGNLSASRTVNSQFLLF